MAGKKKRNFYLIILLKNLTNDSSNERFCFTKMHGHIESPIEFPQEESQRKNKQNPKSRLLWHNAFVIFFEGFCTS